MSEAILARLTTNSGCGKMRVPWCAVYKNRPLLKSGKKTATNLMYLAKYTTSKKQGLANGPADFFQLFCDL